MRGVGCTGCYPSLWTPPVRLANHLYTHSKVEISEGLGEGRDT